ncbi:site-specific integrase [[Kitasatospora] papulosa]|uniref:tyrosine-type recombinase/integrase n=1 Tax=Streptomyces TaxID=1883 RepID=UPI00068D8AAC|nr:MULTISPECIES: tyrosine-type recombinase/integrase [Streptomyces]MCY1652839.1 tyrosine-type recombinase/integrase [Streptomyces sp. SL203]MCY1679942.1 tyrosine-type recombinase/integrase [Streptomyces sp. SL294]WSZ49328.1 site-specific integrase [[Kitasatospora] papulosa]
MAGHIQDRWFVTVTGPDGKPRKVKSDRYGVGSRYRARYVGPDGTEKSKSFPDRQKRLADQWLAHTEADMARGQYIDPRAARTTFQQYAEGWVSTQGADPNTQASMESQLRLHAFPYLGTRPLGSFQPAHIRDWVQQLQANGVRGSYARTIYSNVRAALSAAVDDGHLPRNPCSARSVRPPTVDTKRVTPWTTERLFAVRAGMPERYQAMVDLGGGCGLRQGEILGIAVDAIDFRSDTLHVVQQLKLSRSKPVFAPPKGAKLRDVPLPGPVADALRAHMKQFPPVEITLPWKVAGGPLVTKRLIFMGPRGGHVWRTSLNEEAWKPALASAGVIPVPAAGAPHAESRENGMHAMRHFYASVLLDAGENIKALAEYLGHSDPGLTLRVYAHLMPSSQERTRKAVSAIFGSQNLESGKGSFSKASGLKPEPYI